MAPRRRRNEQRESEERISVRARWAMLLEGDTPISRQRASTAESAISGSASVCELWGRGETCRKPSTARRRGKTGETSLCSRPRARRRPCHKCAKWPMITMLKRRSEKKGLSSWGQSQRPPAHEAPMSAAGSARAAGKVSRGPGCSDSRRRAGVKRGLKPDEPGRRSAAYAAREARDWLRPEAELREGTSARSCAGAPAARARAAAEASPSRRALTREVDGPVTRGVAAARADSGV